MLCEFVVDMVLAKKKIHKVSNRCSIALHFL
jgi:hypothetical protein